MNDNINEHVIFAQLKMIRAEFSGMLVIVEGGTDASLFKKYLNSQVTQIVVAFNKQNAMSAGRKFLKEIDSNCIVIIDKDFDELLGHLVSSINYIYTDYHDVEMHLINSSACSSVLLETIDESKCVYSDYQNLNCIKHIVFPISVLRYLSLQEDWGLYFNDFEVTAKCFAESIILENIINQIIARTINHLDKLIHEKPSNAKYYKERKMNIVKKEIVLQKVNEFKLENYPLDCFTNGHDVVLLFSFLLKKKGLPHSRKYESSDIERMLRISYSMDEFKKTNMYHKLDHFKLIKTDI